MTTAAKTIFESMKRIVEAPGYPLLQSEGVQNFV